MELMTAAYIGYTVSAEPSSGEVLGYYLAGSGLFLVFIFLPSAIIYFMR